MSTLLLLCFRNTKNVGWMVGEGSLNATFLPPRFGASARAREFLNFLHLPFAPHSQKGAAAADSYKLKGSEPISRHYRSDWSEPGRQWQLTYLPTRSAIHGSPPHRSSGSTPILTLTTPTSTILSTRPRAFSTLRLLRQVRPRRGGMVRPARGRGRCTMSRRWARTQIAGVMRQLKQRG